MAITYKYHLWGGTDAYLNLPDGVTSRIRIKKMSGTEEVANLDHDLLLSDLMSLDDSGLRRITDRLIDEDEMRDAKALAAMEIVPQGRNTALNNRIKAVELKARVGAEVLNPNI